MSAGRVIREGSPPISPCFYNVGGFAMPTVKELQEQLKAAQKLEQEEREARLKATPPVYRYEVRTVDQKRYMSFHRMYDPECRIYRVLRLCQNAEQLRELGASEWVTNEGGMDYIYNGKTGRIVCSVGGGTMLIDTQEQANRLGAWIAVHPGGGDCTELFS